jgi:hypothetical protein
LGAGVVGGAGALLLWVTSQVLRDPTRNHSLVALLALKAFALLVMGSLGVGFLLGGLGVLFPRLQGLPSPRVPPCLRDLCPGCGVRGEPCGCGPLPEGTWTPPQRTSPFDLFLVAIMAGVGFLGVFVLAEGFLSPNVWWARLGYLLLGLLLAGVGFLAVWGAWLARPSPRKHGEVSYLLQGTLHGASEERTWTRVHARAQVREGALVEAEGSLEVHLRWPSGEARAREMDPAEQALLRLLAAALMLGHLALRKKLLREWRHSATSTTKDTVEGGGYRTTQAEGELLTSERQGLFLEILAWEEEEVLYGEAPPPPAENLEELLRVLASLGTVEACLAAVRAEPILLARVEEVGAQASEGLDRQEVQGWMAPIASEAC